MALQERNTSHAQNVSIDPSHTQSVSTDPLQTQNVSTDPSHTQNVSTDPSHTQNVSNDPSNTQNVSTDHLGLYIIYIELLARLRICSDYLFRVRPYIITQGPCGRVQLHRVSDAGAT